MKNIKTKQITSTAILNKFTDFIFSPEAEFYITIKSKVIDKPKPVLDELGKSLFKKGMTPEEIDIFFKAYDLLNPKSKYISSLEFSLEGKNYEIRENHNEGYLLVSHFKEEKEFVYPDVLNTIPSKDINICKDVINQISETYHYSEFKKEENTFSEKFYNHVIARKSTYTLNIYLSDDMLDLLFKLKFAFTEEEQQFITVLRESKFQMPTNNFLHQLHEFFLNWIEKLKKDGNPFEFGDGDNKAYFKKDKNMLIIVQESQNTIFSYIINLDNYHIKVWNCISVNDENFDYLLENNKSYLNLMKTINADNWYPFELTGSSYPKSANYFFEHFNDESEYLVYDSNKGYRINSEYTDCMATDVRILTDFLK